VGRVPPLGMNPVQLGNGLGLVSGIGSLCAKLFG
jgi:hypothetical protein